MDVSTPTVPPLRQRMLEDMRMPPQALGRRIVPAVALAAHRRLHAVALERVLELAAAVLAAPVRVEDQSGCRLAPEPRHAQGIRDQAGLYVGLHAPAQHLTAEQVDHGGQVQPALAGGDVGDVAGPDPVGRIHRELAVEQVGRNGQRMFAVGGDDSGTHCGIARQLGAAKQSRTRQPSTATAGVLANPVAHSTMIPVMVCRIAPVCLAAVVVASKVSASRTLVSL